MKNDNIFTSNIVPARVNHTLPISYRLAEKSAGVLVLQGEYVWTEGLKYGSEWRDIPTVKLGE